MPMSCAIGKIGIEISVLPHAKLIHLNTADRPLLKTGFERIGFDPVQAEELASKVTRYRARRPLETEDSTGIDGGLKHAPFEDISELNDFVELWDLSTPALARVFSVHDGQTMANGLSNGQRTGDAYSIETKLFARGMQVSDAAVFSVDAGTFARLATLEVDTSMQPGSKQNCSQALGGELPNLLAETIR
jgi:general secretion pathway protein K